MIVAAMIGYGVVAIAVIGLVGYLTGRQGVREIEAAAAEGMARMDAEFARMQPLLGPYVPEPLPDEQDEQDEPEPELRITIRRHPESEDGDLPRVAAGVIREASRLEESYGGDGLEYDPAVSVEEPDRLILRLVPRADDGEAADRLAAVSEELNRAARRAEEQAADGHAVSILAKIEEQLHPRLPRGVIERVEVADGVVEEPEAVVS